MYMILILIRLWQVAIVGFGAFAVENIRTCCEHRAEKIFLVCRRKNLCMPRMVSWWINSSVFPVAAGDVLREMEAFHLDVISYSIMVYYILLYYIILHHIISYHIISYHIISYHIISYHIISYHIISYHIIS